MQERLAQEAVQKGYSVRQLERRVRQLTNRLDTRGSRGRLRETRDELATLQDLMTRTLGLDVSVSGNRKKGTVRIRYGSRNELESLLSRLGVIVH
jgi:ParB family chromosome partitioning protein